MRSKIAVIVAVASVMAGNSSYVAAIEAEGVAAIDRAGIEHARRMATNEALREASMRAGAIVIGSEQMTSGGSIVQSSTVRPAGTAHQFAVLRDRSDGGNIHVSIRAADQMQAADRAYSHPYRKKVLLTPFYVNRAAHATDVDDFTNGIPRDLSRRLDQNGKYQPRVSRFAVPPGGAGGSDEQTVAAVKRLALEHDSQFVVTGEVVDAGIRMEKSFFSSSASRRFEARMLVYDGLTGVLIAQHQHSMSIQGNVGIGVDKPFGSNAFFATEFGKGIDSIMSVLVGALADDLDHLPFTARIVQIENRKIIFDAGTTSAVMPGDRMVAYKRKIEWGIVSPMQGTASVVETPEATVTVVQVQPTFSIGEVSEEFKGVSLKVGDYVRFSTAH